MNDKSKHTIAFIHNTELKLEDENPNLYSQQDDESNNVTRNSSTFSLPQLDELDHVEEPDVYATVKKKPVLLECEYAAVNKTKN